MHITFSPQRRDDAVSVSVTGDTIYLNGAEFDFTALPDGSALPASAIGSEWFCGSVERIAGELHLTLRLPHGPDASEAARLPQPITVTADGDVELPQ